MCKSCNCKKVYASYALYEADNQDNYGMAPAFIRQEDGSIGYYIPAYDYYYSTTLCNVRFCPFCGRPLPGRKEGV